MMSIHYDELKMQNYFNDKNLSTAEKLTVFRWRIHMEKVFDGNFRAGRKQVMCVCGAHTDKQRITFESCPLTFSYTRGVEYENIFQENISLKTIRSICYVTKMREDLRKKQG